MAAHPVEDAAAHAVAVGGHGLEVEAAAAVAHEDLDGLVVDLGVDVDARHPGVPGGVGQGLAGRRDDRAQRLVERGVTDRDHVDGHAVGVLDARGGGAQRAGHAALVDRLLAVEPGAQVALLAAGQPGDGGAVVGGALDQRQGLQHRVVQVGGDVGALLAAHPLLALRGQVGGQPVEPRPDHDPDAGDADQGGQHQVAGGRGAAVAQEHQSEGGDHEQRPGHHPGVRRPAARAEDGPQRVDAPGGVEPALALRLVGLAPQQRDADQADRHRPEHDALAQHRLDREQQPEGQRTQRDHLADVTEATGPAGPAPVAGGTLEPGRAALEPGVGRQHQPQAGVQHDAEAAGRGADQERHPHPEHGHAEVACETAGDTAEHGGVRVAVGPARRELGGGHQGSIVAPPREHGP